MIQSVFDECIWMHKNHSLPLITWSIKENHTRMVDDMQKIHPAQPMITEQQS